MSLQDDIEYLKARIFALEDRVKTSPHFRWGTVVTLVPLTIILDGAADALSGTPANAGPKVMMVGERVRVELQGNRAVVHAVGGRVNDLRGTSAQRVALAMSGAAVQGMRFWDTDEKKEYMWGHGGWEGGSEDLVSYLIPGTSGTLVGIIRGGVAELTSNFNGIEVMSGTSPVDVSSALPDKWRPERNKWGTVWANGFAGGAVIRANGTLAFANRTGTNWGITTPYQSTVTYMVAT